jgi:hypothetical protein
MTYKKEKPQSNTAKEQIKSEKQQILKRKQQPENKYSTKNY